MAKKMAKGKTAKVKKAGKSKKGTSPTAAEILELWKKQAIRGLGSKKAFAKEIGDFYKPKLIDAIQKQLDMGNEFSQKTRIGTSLVARAVGIVCVMVTKDRVVPKEKFDLVFEFLRDHHAACPGGGGGGDWCDING